MLPIVFATARRMKQDVLLLCACLHRRIFRHARLPAAPIRPDCRFRILRREHRPSFDFGSADRLHHMVSAAICSAKCWGAPSMFLFPNCSAAVRKTTTCRKNLAKAGTVVAIMLIPMLLIFLNTGCIGLSSAKNSAGGLNLGSDGKNNRFDTDRPS